MAATDHLSPQQFSRYGTPLLRDDVDDLRLAHEAHLKSLGEYGRHVTQATRKR